MKKLFSHTNKIFAGGLLIALGAFTSCKKLIAIPPSPPTNITRDQVFADSATAMTAVAGVYSFTPGGGGIPYQDGNFTFSTSLSAHEIVNTSGSYGDYGQFYNYNVTPLNEEINGLWTAPYTEIYQVNDILENIKDNSHLSASFIKQITGEMEVVRAFCYFNLTNLFGNVPLVTTTDYATNATSPRVPVAEIYKQIEADLNDAVKKLPSTYPSNSPGHVRVNLYTAIALQSKVHLYQGNWQAAYAEADSVINSGNFSLLTDLNSVFLDGSNEAVWQVPVENAYQGTMEAGNFLPYDSSSLPSYVITDSLINQFEAGDLRMADWMGVNVVNGKNVYFPTKYKDRSPTTPATDYMLLRYADIYLIHAESAAQLNNLATAMADVNTIRARAGLGASKANAASQSAVLAAVRKERRTEMFTEFGGRWFDLNRTAGDTKYPANGQVAAVLPGYQSFDALYPVPQAQLQLNHNLTQNPGYH